MRADIPWFEFGWFILDSIELQRIVIFNENLRSEYIYIFNKIGINSIFIVTHAYYKIEDLVNDKTYPTLTFSDIPIIAKEMDNLTSFDLEKILQTDKVSEICKDFLAKPNLNIAFIDNLNTKREI